MYEGCWVTYDDKIMCGSSKRRLPVGNSFTVLCESKRFRKWFSKVLNGAYKEYDFDTLPLDILISLTSPHSPGSLASDTPAGLGPSVGLSIPNNQAASPVQQGPSRLRLTLPNRGFADPDDQDAVGSDVKGATGQVVMPIKLGSSLDRSSNQSAAIAKTEKAAVVRDGSQLPGQIPADPLVAVQPSDKAALEKRQCASPSSSPLEKRTKTGVVYQRQEAIDISSNDEENAKFDPGNSHSSSNATQNQTLLKEIASLKQSESRAVDRANEALNKMEKLMQENTNLKLAEMRAANRASEALGKLRAANRANEELGGNDNFVERIEELMRENSSLKLSALRQADRADGTVENDDGTLQQIKKENHTGQYEG